MKRFFCKAAKVVAGLAIVMALVLFSGAEGKAESVGYTVSHYNISIQVHEDATFSIREEITADFSEEKHGIKRYIPNSQEIERKDPETGRMKTYCYRTPINDISVEGAPFEMSNEEDDPDGYEIIKIGDEDEYVTGEQSYVISYTFDMGDDRFSTYDWFYFDLIGPDWDTTLNDINFEVGFDKPADLSKLKMYSGKLGSTAEIDDFVVEDNMVIGSVKYLLKNKALTMYVELPEGYYVGERTYSVLFSVIMLALLVLLLIITIVLKVMFKERKNVVQTVEFYPPDGITSAEVGYIIDSSADDKDLISLIPWLADKGYIKLVEEDGDTLFVKLREMEEDAPEYLKKFYHGLFRKGDEARLSDLKSTFYDSVQSSKQKLGKYFDGERKLSVSSVTAMGLTFMALAALFGVLGLWCHNLFVDSGLVLGELVFAVVLLVYSLFLARHYRERFFLKKTGIIIGGCISFVIIASCVLFTIRANTFGKTWIIVVIYLVMIAISLIASTLFKPTKYKIEMTGKLLGLRQFIKEAELDRIQTLVMENPSYFYSILPYAYVFGLTDKWVKQFESITMAPPNWYYGRSDMFTTYYLINHMNHITTQTQRQMSEVAASRAKSSSSSSGGGGFSGGGFGGGGGSSW